MSERYAPADHLAERTLLVAASYVLLRRAGRVLLELRAGTGYRDGCWAMVAGHVDPGESAVAAAVRECAEEVGVRVRAEDLQPVTAMHRFWPGGGPVEQRIDLVFQTWTFEGEPHRAEPDRAAEVAWFDLTALPSPVVPHEAVVLTALACGETLPAVLTYRADLERPAV